MSKLDDFTRECNEPITAEERIHWRGTYATEENQPVFRLLSRYEYSLARAQAKLNRGIWIVSQLMSRCQTREEREAIQDWLQEPGE